MSDYLKTSIEPERLKGTKTEQNLHTALSGESQAYLRYKWFEAKAKKDGYVDVASIFCETAGNEKEHAEIWFNYLGGLGDTEHNLSVAANGEHFEWESMYAQFAKEAREEGFEPLALLFERVASIEKMHEARYRCQYNKIKNGEMFKSNSSHTKWICLNCGYIIEGSEPPAVCPTCMHPKGYFKAQEQ
ncbi:MAG: rubrerythrin family protein [Clostridia bacterium]|nr:rubrerythrin family protein [Clostridia bacterium]